MKGKLRSNDRLVTAERLREVLDYDPETGRFQWRMSIGSIAQGSKAGSERLRQYRTISIDGTKYLAHRLAWLYVYGEHPPGFVDHVNRDPDDNRIANLRLCTRAQNRQNSKSRNISGFKGVYLDRRGKVFKWHARIKVAGKDVPLGYFATPEEAAAVYDAAARVHHGEFAVINLPKEGDRRECPTSAGAEPATQRKSGSSRLMRTRHRRPRDPK